MNYLRFIFGFLLQLVVQRVLRPHTVYRKLAIISLVMSGGALIMPLWEHLLIIALSHIGLNSPVSSINPFISGGVFIGLAFMFAYLSNLDKPSTEKLVDTKLIGASVKVGLSEVAVFCGSVLDIENIDLVVASEDTMLDLGNINGTSVSGRVRKLAATFDSGGRIIVDPIKEDIEKWKKNKGYAGPFALGECIPVQPYRANSKGIRGIIYSIALEKNGSGENRVEESANRTIIDKVLIYSKSNNLNSIFIPIFGLGSGSISRNDAISKTLLPLLDRLNRSPNSYKIYLGVYRISDATLLGARLLKGK